MAALRTEIDRAAGAHGLMVLGQTQEGASSLALIGMAPAGWARFTKSPEYGDDLPDPLDRWSQRILPLLAAQTGARAVAYPFGGPPYAPFIRWAFESGETFSSPVGMLVHATAGFWISFRGALIFAKDHAPAPARATASPCPGCAAPCENACPVAALAPGRDYDVSICKAHVASPSGRACREGGCLVRQACPVGQCFGRDPAQSAFHMRAFLGVS